MERGIANSYLPQFQEILLNSIRKGYSVNDKICIKTILAVFLWNSRNSAKFA